MKFVSQLKKTTHVDISSNSILKIRIVNNKFKILRQIETKLIRVLNKYTEFELKHNTQNASS